MRRNGRKAAAFALAGILAVQGVAGASAAESTTEAQSQTGTEQERQESEAISGDVQDSLHEYAFPENQPIKVTVSCSVVSNNPVYSKALDGSSLQYLMEYTGDRIVMNYDAIFMNTNICRGLFSVSQDEIAFSLPDIDDTRYVYPVKELFHSLYGDSGKIGTDTAADPYAEWLAPYVQTVKDFMDETSQTQTVETSLYSIDRKAELTISTWTPSGEQAAELCDRIADQIENDDTLNAFLNEYADFLEAFQNTADSVSEDVRSDMEGTESETEGLSSGSENLESGSLSTVSGEALTSIRSFCSTAPDKIREAEEDMAAAFNQGDIVVYTGFTEDGKLALVDVQLGGSPGTEMAESMSPSGSEDSDSTTGASEETQAAGDTQSSAEETQTESDTQAGTEDASEEKASRIVEFNYENYDGQMCFYMGTDGQDNILRMDTAYENTDEQHTGQYSVAIGGMKYIAGGYTIDQTKKSMLGIPYGSFSMSLAGMINLGVETAADTNGGDMTTIKLDGLEYLNSNADSSDSDVDISSAAVHILSEKSDEHPAQPDGTDRDLTTMTSDDWEALSEKFSQSIENKIEPLTDSLRQMEEESTEAGQESEADGTAAFGTGSGQ